MREIQAKKRSDEEKKEIYDKWSNLINMSQNALDSWSENENRLLASINRSKAKEEGGIQSGYDSFHRIKRRKGKKFEDWSAQDFDNASQENGFNSRMLGGKPGDPIGGSGMSKWEISLKNWGHDPSLKSSPQHAKWRAWKMKHTKKAGLIKLPKEIKEMSEWLLTSKKKTRDWGYKKPKKSKLSIVGQVYIKNLTDENLVSSLSNENVLKLLKMLLDTEKNVVLDRGISLRDISDRNRNRILSWAENLEEGNDTYRTIEKTFNLNEFALNLLPDIFNKEWASSVSSSNKNIEVTLKVDNVRRENVKAYTQGDYIIFPMETLRKYNNHDLISILKHEMTHTTQKVYRLLGGMEAGNPAKKIKDNYVYNTSKLTQEEWARSDDEFYPNLRQIVDDIVLYLKEKGWGLSEIYSLLFKDGEHEQGHCTVRAMDQGLSLDLIADKTSWLGNISNSKRKKVLLEIKKSYKRTYRQASSQRVAYKHLQKTAVVKLPKIRLKLKQFFMGVIAKRIVHLLKNEQVDFVKTKPFVNRINTFLKGLRKYGEKGFVNASLTLIEEQDFPYKVEGLDLDQDLTVQATALYGETISRGMSQAGASNGISDEGRVEISIFNLDSLAYKMLEDIDEVIEDVSQMVDHESIHYVQRILQRHKDSSAGLPKKKERTPEWGQKNMGQGNDGLSTFQSYSGLSKHHVLDDIEFWPFVQDLTTNSIRTIKRTEVSAEKIIELLTSKKALKEMSLFPGSHMARKTDLRFLDKNIQYLSIMAEDAPRKYKRSIKELKKELQKKGLLQ